MSRVFLTFFIFLLKKATFRGFLLCFINIYIDFIDIINNFAILNAPLVRKLRLLFQLLFQNLALLRI